MSARRALIILGSVAASILVTAIIVWSQHQRNETLQTDYYLRWGRHLVGQAENLVLRMEPGSETDPYVRAAQMLSQGGKNRPYRIYPAQLPISGANELFEMNQAASEFDYARITEARTGQGFRVRMAIEYSGFMGTRSDVAEDLMIFSCFLLVTILIYLPLSMYYLPPQTQATAPLVDAEPDRAGIEPERIHAVRRKLVSVGSHVRSVFRDCRDLLKVISEVRGNSGRMESSLKGSLESVDQVDQAFQNLGKVTSEIEERAIRLIMENGSPEDEMMVLARVTEEIYPVLAKVENGIRSGRKKMKKIKVELESNLERSQRGRGVGAQLEVVQRDLQNHLNLTLEALTDHAQELKKIEEDAPPSPSSSQEPDQAA